ncbi:MAG: DUF4407 domain-containing protein [Actinobacteria bacterium]|nr:DUF4407 domain-containing protein [Actinomycetota bacterium]
MPEPHDGAPDAEGEATEDFGRPEGTEDPAGPSASPDLDVHENLLQAERNLESILISPYRRVAGSGRARWGPLRGLFIKISNAERRYLQHCPSDVTYFTFQGVTLVITATFTALGAAIAATIAFELDRPALVVVAPMAALWGLAILSLDKFLIADDVIGFRVNRDSQTPGIVQYLAHFLRETVKIVPRIVLAIVLGFMFSEPILLLLFRDEVQAELQEIREEEIRAEAIQVRSSAQAAFNSADAALKQIETDRATALKPSDEQLAVLQEDLRREVQGLNPSAERTCGPICEDITQLIGDAEQDRNDRLLEFNAEHDEEAGLQTQRNNASLILQEPLPHLVKRLRTENGPDGELRFRLRSGLLAERAALERLGSSPGAEFAASDGPTDVTRAEVEQEAKALRDTKMVLRLALIGIDTLPVLSKWLTAIFRRRTYYDLVSADIAETRAEAEAREEVAKRRKEAVVDAEARLAGVRTQLTEWRREYFQKTIIEARIRLGLHQIERAVNDARRSAVAADSDDDLTPAQAPIDPDAPTPTSGGTSGPPRPWPLVHDEEYREAFGRPDDGSRPRRSRKRKQTDPRRKDGG